MHVIKVKAPSFKNETWCHNQNSEQQQVNSLNISFNFHSSTSKFSALQYKSCKPLIWQLTHVSNLC